MTRPITILVSALGGEGGGVLAEWLYAAAVRAGFAAQATSIPGVAQRTGATTYYVEIHPDPGARRPVFSLSPVPGGVDLFVSSELLEAVRQAGAGYVCRERTRVIASTARALTVAEKMQLGDGRADDAKLIDALRAQSKSLDLVDTAALAQQAGTAVSAVLFGAIAGSGVLPFGGKTREACEAAIRASGKGVEASLRGFDAAWAALGAARHLPSRAPRSELSLDDIRALADDRLVAYQDRAYADLYAARLKRLADAGADDPTRTEAARWLVLWMCFDDIVRVAQLKLAASRHKRVLHEVRANPGDVVKVYDHFKPGVAEFAALLPAQAAQRLQTWNRGRVAAGREPFALPIKLPSHTVLGTLVLKLLASCKPLRRRGSRFAIEQSLIDEWLAAIASGAHEHPALALELARCGRLVKGYGSTNERGKENLLHIVRHLAARSGVAPAQRADTIREAREAALADDAGRALDRTLVAHGAPKRPPREQVVRWYKRKPAG